MERLRYIPLSGYQTNRLETMPNSAGRAAAGARRDSFRLPLEWARDTLEARHEAVLPKAGRALSRLGGRPTRAPGEATPDMFSILSKPIRRPDLWAMHLRCARCDWRTTPDGPYRRLDVMFPPSRCPNCRGETMMVIPDCPYCERAQIAPGDSLARSLLGQVRAPRSWAQALWGHFTCRTCRRVFDKWGRKTH